VRGLDFDDFAGTKNVLERNKSWLPVDWCTMPSASSILWVSAENIDEVFSRGFLHIGDARMAADPTASPILDTSVKMRV